MPLLALPVLLSVLPQAAPQPAPTAVFEAAGAHYHVQCHFGSADLAQQALAAAEATWPLALAALDQKEKKLAAPLEVHLYPDATSYEAAEQPLTHGAFRANLAFSHFATKSAHVALQPPCSPEALHDLGLPTLTRYLIAHEACHLAVYAFLPNAEDHPDWFSDGLAQDVACRALIGLGLAKGIDEEPCLSQGSFLCQALLAKKQLPGVDSILEERTTQVEPRARYGLYRLFYGFLRQQEEKDLRKATSSVARLGGGPGYKNSLKGELGKLWKDKDRAALDQRFRAYVQTQKPAWDEVFRSLETHGPDFVQRGWDNNAIAFSTAPLTTLPITAKGILRVLPGEKHQMNFLLGRNDKGYLSVAFLVGESVTLFDHKNAGNEWPVLATAPAPTTRIGQDVGFRIEVSATELVVFIGIKEVLRAPLEGHSPLGQWGLSAQDKTTGEWKALVVKTGK